MPSVRTKRSGWGNWQVTPIEVMHARLPILGYRVGRMAYITDMKTIADCELDYLQGLELLVLNGLRHEPHYSHQTIEELVRLPAAYVCRALTSSTWGTISTCMPWRMLACPRAYGWHTMDWLWMWKGSDWRQDFIKGCSKSAILADFYCS